MESSLFRSGVEIEQILDADFKRIAVLENLQASFESFLSIESFTEVDKALYNVSVVTAQEALSRYEPIEISNEASVIDTIKQIIAAIGRAIGQIFKRITSFLTNLLSDVSIERKRIYWYKMKIDEYRGRFPRQNEVKLSYSTAMRVSTEKGFPETADVLHLSYSEALKQLKAIRTHYVPRVKKIGHDLQSVLTNRGDSLDQWLENLNTVAGQYNVNYFAHLMSSARPMPDVEVRIEGVENVPRDAVLVGPMLPGQRSLTFTDGVKVHSGKPMASPVDRANALQSSNVRLAKIRTGREIRTDEKMRVMSLSQMEQFLDLITSILDEIEEGTRTRVGEDLRNDGQLFRQAMEKSFTGSWQDVDGDTRQTTIRRALGYGVTYSEWTSRPYLELLGHCFHAAAAGISVVGSHLRAYA